LFIEILKALTVLSSNLSVLKPGNPKGCLAFLPLCHFTPWLIRPLALDDLPPDSFASWLVHALADSPHGGTIRPH